jgi:hypothetical protein
VLPQKESWSIPVLLGRIKLQIPISETSHEAKLHSELQKGTFTIKSPRIFNIFIKHRRPTYKENSVYLTKLALNQKSTFSHSTIMQYMYCILIWPCSPERDLWLDFCEVLLRLRALPVSVEVRASRCWFGASPSHWKFFSKSLLWHIYYGLLWILVENSMEIQF